MTPGTTPRPRVVGILNVTPDSFSDGGKFAHAERALEHARQMADEGVDIIDIGGESTRPGFTPISAETELARLYPVLDALKGVLPVPLSVDTTKAKVARAALDRGVTMVNDIWGLQGDPAMAGVVAEAGATVVVMHNRSTPDDALAIGDEMMRFFEISLAVAGWAGIARNRIILDPGVGFGKSPRQQVEALAAIPRLLGFGLPVLVGLSRKSFLGRLTGSTLDRRLTDTVAANLAAFHLGASLFRVHDVAAHVAALTVYSAIARGSA